MPYCVGKMLIGKVLALDKSRGAIVFLYQRSIQPNSSWTFPRNTKLKRKNWIDEMIKTMDRRSSATTAGSIFAI